MRIIYSCSLSILLLLPGLLTDQCSSNRCWWNCGYHLWRQHCLLVYPVKWWRGWNERMGLQILTPNSERSLWLITEVYSAAILNLRENHLYFFISENAYVTQVLFSIPMGISMYWHNSEFENNFEDLLYNNGLFFRCFFPILVLCAKIKKVQFISNSL